MHYITAGTTLGLSLLHCAAFVGAMYLSLDIVFSQYELASPLPICTIIFTALYGATELCSGFSQFKIALMAKDAGIEWNVQSIVTYYKDDNKADERVGQVTLFANRIGMAGIIACAVAGVVEYFNSGTHAPCMLQTLAEKIHPTPETHLSPEVVYEIIAAAVVLLLALYIASVYGRDKTDDDETTAVDDRTTFVVILNKLVRTELEGFAAPCLMGCKQQGF